MERRESEADLWRKKLNRVFAIAAIDVPFTSKPHPHRFRHTFGVNLLQRGVSLEDTAVLLGHSSVKITERHYATWAKGRQDRLERVLKSVWLSEAGGGNALPAPPIN